MPASKAQQKAVNKYMNANYDRINLTMPKGKKEKIQAHVKQTGESVNGFINRAIDSALQADQTENENQNHQLNWWFDSAPRRG